MSKKPVATRNPIFQWLPIVRLDSDDKNSQPGGLRLSSSEGGIDKTKTVSKNPADGMDVDLLLEALGSLGGYTLPKSVEITCKLKSILEKAVKISNDLYAKSKEKCKFSLCNVPNCDRGNIDKIKKAINDAIKDKKPTEIDHTYDGSTHWQGGNEIEVPCNPYDKK